MKNEDKERFAERMIQLCDMFNKYPSQYDSIIQGYWDAMHKSMTLEEFEEAANTVVREMYVLATPKQILDLAFRTRTGSKDQEQELDQGQIQEQREIYEGKNLIKLMTEQERNRLYHLASGFCKGAAGEWWDNLAPVTRDALVDTKMCQLAWHRENRGKA